MRKSTKLVRRAPIRIAILALDGAIYSSIIGPMDVFSVANALNAGSGHPDFAQVRILREGRRSPHSFNRLFMHTQGGIDTEDQFDVVILPAMMRTCEAEEEAFPAFQSTRLTDWLIRQHAGGACLSSVCAGAFLLARTGLLEGRSATTHWNVAAQFQKRFPNVRLQPRKMLIDEQDLVTAGGVTAYFDLALHLVRRFGSVELAAGCSKFLLIDPQRESQSPYQAGLFQKSHADAAILALQDYLEHHFKESVTLEQMGTIAGLEQRTLLRRFKSATGDSPVAYLQRVRIEAARRQLERSRDTIDEIAWQVGYEDSSSFNRLFKKITGMTPGSYRHKFSLTVMAMEK
ncbi:MAG: helix-turn-helix domain-containing protein [Desulfobacteraceae bacterium]